MPQFGTRQLDIRDQNVAVEKVLAATENPRHRYLLQSYLRHRYLESAGRYQEILVPEMTVEHPVYRFSLIGQPRFTLDGREQVEAVYRHWTQTDQCVFYVEDESVAVGDHLIVGRGIGYQQRLGAELAASGLDADPGAWYLERFQMVMVWPYDDQCRLIGEDLWEFDDAEHALIKLDPADVLTAAQAGELLAPLIKPLPPFDAGCCLRPAPRRGRLMRAVTVQHSKLELVELADPQPAAGQVVLDVLGCGICGSDLHARLHADAEADALTGGRLRRLHAVRPAGGARARVRRPGRRLRPRHQEEDRGRDAGGGGAAHPARRRGARDRALGGGAGRLRRAGGGRGVADVRAPERAVAQARGADRAARGRLARGPPGGGRRRATRRS